MSEIDAIDEWGQDKKAPVNDRKVWQELRYLLFCGGCKGTFVSVSPIR